MGQDSANHMWDLIQKSKGFRGPHTINSAFADKSEGGRGGDTFLGGAAPPPDRPRFLPNYDFPGKFRFFQTFLFLNFQALGKSCLWGFWPTETFLRHWEDIYKQMIVSCVWLVLHAQIFHFFQNVWFAITAIRASPGPETLQDSCSIKKVT